MSILHKNAQYQKFMPKLPTHMADFKKNGTKFVQYYSVYLTEKVKFVQKRSKLYSCHGGFS